MFETGDFESHFFGKGDEFQRFIRLIGVNPGEHFAFQHFHQRFQPKVFPGRNQTFVLLCCLVVSVPVLFVLFGAQKLPPNDGYDPHPGLRIAGSPPSGTEAVGPLGIFSQGKFQGTESFAHQHVLRRFSPFHLQCHIFARNGIGAAVHGVDHGHTTGEGGENAGIFGVDDIPHLDFRGDGVGSFIGSCQGDVGVGIDDAGHHVQARGTDLPCSIRRLEISPDSGDDPLFDQDIPVFDRPFGDGQHGPVLDQ